MKKKIPRKPVCLRYLDCDDDRLPVAPPGAEKRYG